VIRFKIEEALQRTSSHLKEYPMLKIRNQCALALCLSSLLAQFHHPILLVQSHHSEGHVDWVAEVLTRMQTVKPGMTRDALLKVFTTEGGISTALHRTFVSRDCPYFKVDVDFKPVGRPDRDRKGRVTRREDPGDIIVTISRPYLALGLRTDVYSAECSHGLPGRRSHRPVGRRSPASCHSRPSAICDRAELPCTG
jgi:hypothetical protein